MITRCSHTLLQRGHRSAGATTAASVMYVYVATLEVLTILLGFPLQWMKARISQTLEGAPCTPPLQNIEDTIWITNWLEWLDDKKWIFCSSQSSLMSSTRWDWLAWAESEPMTSIQGAHHSMCLFRLFYHVIKLLIICEIICQSTQRVWPSLFVLFAIETSCYFFHTFTSLFGVKLSSKGNEQLHVSSQMAQRIRWMQSCSIFWWLADSFPPC